ncbi:RIP metalloprotease RseP [Dysgonomonas sp. 216]|uniref:RIP metalloprotease RseP n=1 Tax=Dysgonomonas sp. 216 TaxID=2302934 RepID=UPI0013D783A3|nr:RIP metalloprotease RseP [Dysgonomonas sp. 216]NDW19037.1 RIP metalloprotease RseP [Dysgonomonas sp. 216]
MESFLIKALQLILSLSILVIIHEFGHFLFARLFKIRVEKFYLFFDPWFSLFKFKPKNSDTEYGIGWLPLGGYVKISGMIDESMDKEQMAQPPQPWEFRSKPAWQRLLVMVGGVVFNFILAIFIYSMILFASGDKYVYLKDIKMGMEFGQVPTEVGFVDGDILVSADGEYLKYRDTRTLDSNMLLDILNAKTVQVIRDGKEHTINIPEDFMDRYVAAKSGFWAFRIPTVVDSLKSGSEAERIGLQHNDRLIAINYHETPTFSSFLKEMQDCKNDSIDLSLVRNGEEITLRAAVDSMGTLGFYGKDGEVMMGKNLSKFYPEQHDSYGFFQSFPAGISLGVATLKGYINQFRLVFSMDGLSNIGGFGTIGSLFPAQWDWHAFWMMTAFLSIMLAFMNILPIPALDGGHVMFLLYEVITRRKPSEKFMERATMVGMIFLFGLILYANGNDLFKWISEKFF